MIEVESLTFSYPGAGGHAVEDVSFQVSPGEIVGLLGPSGAGKSTIQKIMIKLLPMQQGHVRYEGVEIRELDRAFFNRVGVSFEHPNVFPKLTAAENLAYFAGLYDRDVMPAKKALERVGLGEHADKPAGDYSKGMKQRLVLARALQHRPDVLFLDEPTSGLDPATGQKIMDLIAEERDRGAAIVLTTHNMHAADTLCDRLAFLHGGRIVAIDSPRELKLAHGERVVEIEYRRAGALESARFGLDAHGRAALERLLGEVEVETMHTREASLDQIFIELTGSELHA